MATWIDFIRTNKGLALDAKLISRTLPLTITKAMSGEGRVSPLLLREQKELALPKQILSLGEKQQTDDYAAIMLPVKLSNEGIDLKYSMYQIGVFADDPDEGEILYMICQTSTEEGEEVPSEKEQPAFSIQWNLKIKVSDTDDVVVQVADVGMITQDEADLRYVQKDEDLDMGHFTDETPVMLHAASPNAHQNLNIDGNAGATSGLDEGLATHLINPDAHQNLNVDGNNN